MDSRIKELGKDQRIALARIVYDLIMADKIIDDDEVVKFAKLFGEDENRTLFHQAQELSFAKAVKLLSQPGDEITDSEAMRRLHEGQRRKHAEKAAAILNETANSDGFCAPAEAVLLVALDYFLKKNNATYSKYDIQSFKLTDVFIGKRFVLYAETGASPMSLQIEENYDLIVNLLAGIDFHFIYIPKLVEQYKRKGLEMFKAMSMYIFPDIAEEKGEEVFNNIIGMTTKGFVKSCLNDKLGFDIVCPRPALMVMLGRSSVIGKDLSDKGLAYETFANFLKISLDDKEDILHVVGRFVNDFNRFASFNSHIDFNPAKDKLLYHGIYKAFFRMVALVKDAPNRYNINISTNLGGVFINDRKLPLAAGKAAIYIMVLCRSFFGDKKGLPMRKVYKTLKEDEQSQLQAQYEWIVSQLKNKGSVDIKPLYPNVQNRMSDIRIAISEIVGKRFVGEIQIGTGEYVKTIVSPDRVTVNGIPIMEHPEWKNLM